MGCTNIQSDNENNDSVNRGGGYSQDDIQINNRNRRGRRNSSNEDEESEDEEKFKDFEEIGSN